MEKVFIYRGENKKFEKLSHISNSLKGLSYLGCTTDYCALKISEKLERKLKLFKFSIKRPRKMVFLHKIISTCTVCTLSDYKDKMYKSWTEKESKYYSDGKYKKMPKSRKDNQKTLNTNGGHHHGTGKLFCIKCHFTHKIYKYYIRSENNISRWDDAECCPNCGEKDSNIYLHSSVRVPRKKSNKKTWENFYKLFVYPKK